MAESKFGQIPEPSEDPEALLNTVKALKIAVEQLTGAAGKLAPTRNFVQRDTPTAVTIGDTWLKPSQMLGDAMVTSTWDGKQWIVDGAASKVKVTRFNASGTFTPDPKCIFGYVRGKAAGGGSIALAPGVAAQGGGGGAEGNTVIKFFVRSNVSPTVTVTIGAGVVAGAGGDTTFGSLLTAKGGLVGSIPTAGSANNTGNVGDIIILGDTGGTGMYSPADQFATGGAGGGSGGGRGAACGGSSFENPIPGVANSGGGAGGAAANTANNTAHGTGGSGVLYVVEFLSP